MERGNLCSGDLWLGDNAGGIAAFCGWSRHGSPEERPATGIARRVPITAADVAGFDETTLRSGPAGEKKYVHGAFTERYSAFWLGTRSLDSMHDAGILPGFAGVAVSDRYQNYFHPRWEHIAGNQACLFHLLRDCEDCAETYPGAVWPVQAQRALRGLIRRHPGPPRHPRLYRHHPQARPQHHGRPARPHARQALATARTRTLPVTGVNRATRHPACMG